MTTSNEIKTKTELDMGNVQIAMDAFTEHIKLYKPGVRLDVYDVIIDCRKSLFNSETGENFTFEECMEAFSNLSRNKLIKPGMGQKTYIVK